METMTYTDKRLPEGYTVFLNRFDEYVVCDTRDMVARIENGFEYYNTRASNTLEGAVQNFINKVKYDSQLA